MPWSRRVLVGCVAVILVAGCNSGSHSRGTSTSTSSLRPTTSSTSTPTSTTPGAAATPAAAVQTHNPKVEVTPSADLSDGERVEVAVTGFGVGGKFFLSECASAARANSLGCGPQLAAQPFGVTNNSGAGSFGFTVTSMAAVSPYNTTSTLYCTDQCVIVATVGGGGGFSYTPITFANGPPCSSAQLSVTEKPFPGGGYVASGLGNSGVIILFKNVSSTACSLYGYPGVAGLDSSGRQVTQARRQPRGMFGGLPFGDNTIPVVTPGPGQVASATVNGTDNPQGNNTSCPTLDGLLVTPPNTYTSVRLPAAPGDCSGLDVTPVVPGDTGQG